MTKSIQVDSLRSDDTQENAVTLMRNDDDSTGTVSIWIQNEDGEAADEFTFDQWLKLENTVRKLMGWER